MDLNELQSVRDRERQTDKLQQLRESFYADAGEFIQQLRAERDRAVERAEDPFDSPEVRQLSDEIKTAQQTVEAIYEKRVGKIVKAASFAAADLPAEVDGMTAEEQALFENLVGNIEDNRNHVLALIDGDEPPSQGSTDSGATTTAPAEPAPGSDSQGRPSSDPAGGSDEPAPAQSGDTSEDVPAGWDDGTDSDGVTAAEVMGGDTGPPEGAPARRTDTGQQTDGAESTAPQNTGEPSPQAGEAGPVGDPESVPPSGEPVDPPVRKDGGQETATQGGQTADQEPAPAMERQRVQMLEGVETFLGFDERDYDLEADDVVTLPATNADILLEQGVAREL